LSLSSKNIPPQPQLPTPVADDPPIHTVLKVEENLFTSLKDLFWKIEKQKKRTGAMAPTQFVNTVKRENEIFRSTMHQDAHEFLNFLLNKIAEDVIDLKKLDLSKIRSESGDSTPTPLNEKENGSCEEHSIDSNTSWVQDLFEGVLVNETRCLTCETVICLILIYTQLIYDYLGYL
jgi:ubiquitin C-terminal hydrolase